MSRNLLANATATEVRHTPFAQSAVQYRGTTVAERQGNTITLNSGGYRTATTKKRMNQFSDEFLGSAFHVRQTRGEWFVDVGPGRTFEFFDGVSFEI